MTPKLMSNLHHNDAWAWTLGEREAQTLGAAPAQRWLRVDEGCLWLTQRDSHGQREDDIWLVAGQSLALPPGSAWVLEAWPQARLSLLLQAPLPATRRRAGAWSAWWQRPARWLRFSVLHA